ncbi:helix-turn-helix domain-containing protein [Halobacillus litoralis]|uniref:helix-turn-helix domain-containing protein n=1 Tax=Halobacillus litoralis TaxID=45668 RepID=UPI00136ADFA6|nr:helix-turn-helix transcriptional regulator [Halobacillus litoralis]MYL37396.1 helix-turn-helix domain-containing protein [Halobacillus litoralis]
MLSQRLKYARKNKKLTQDGLAKLVNTSKGTISNYENGYSTPSNDMLVTLADALDVSVDYLLGRTLKANTHNTDDFDPIYEINKLLRKYDVDDMAFFDLEKWKSMNPEQIKELENYFRYLVQKSKEHKEKH